MKNNATFKEILYSFIALVIICLATVAVIHTHYIDQLLEINADTQSKLDYIIADFEEPKIVIEMLEKR